MLEVKVSLNETNVMADLKAVRIKPSDPKVGELCTYQFFVGGTYSGMTFKYPYGDGVKMSRVMLAMYIRLLESV